MEKIKLNNQIVLMRKYVKQAKVHLINKLTKQLKLLQNRKGNEVQIQKAKRKAERFLEVITLLKKIKPDYVSKLALAKASKWEDILQKKNSTLNDRCVAMLANYKAVQKEVEAFHCSNKDLVLKISDLIEQWEEKNKYSKSSSKGKIASGEIGKGDKKMEKQKTNESMLNDSKNKTDILKSDDPSASEEKILKNMKDYSNENNKQSKLSVQPAEISETGIIYKQKLDSSVDADENSSQNETHFDHPKNAAITKRDLEENAMDADNFDASENSEYEDTVENTIKVQKSALVENSTESKHSDSDEDLEVNEMEMTDSDTDEESEENLESIGDITENQQQKIKKENKNSVTTQDQYRASTFIKKTGNDINSSEKKLKAIALLNLDELQGLDEIPVKNTTEKNQSDESEKESSEEEIFETSQNKRKDPFFLGCGDEEPVSEKKLTSFPKNDYLSNKHSAFSGLNRAARRRNKAFLEKQENSNEYDHGKNFQQFSKDTHFSRKDGAKFQKERGNFKPFQKDKFMTKNYEGKFQTKGKSDFNRKNKRNEVDSKTKGKFTQKYKEKRHEDNMQLDRNNGDKFSVKHLEHKKDNSNNKPLHPSWEAKRKQKELINTSFQGKRIVFGD